jgi:hypothetical protein
MSGAQFSSSLPRYIWVRGPHAKAKEGIRMKPAARNKINDMFSFFDSYKK